jgi:hypothetical protein
MLPDVLLEVGLVAMVAAFAYMVVAAMGLPLSKWVTAVSLDVLTGVAAILVFMFAALLILGLASHDEWAAAVVAVLAAPMIEIDPWLLVAICSVVFVLALLGLALLSCGR